VIDDSADKSLPFRNRMLNDLDRLLGESIVGSDADIHPPKNPIRDLRRARGRVPADPVRTASLVDRDGVLFFEAGLLASEPPGRRGILRGRIGTSGGAVLRQIRFEELGHNQITEMWGRLDDSFRDSQKNRGLLQWNDGRLSSLGTPPADGKILLVIHGTFSNSANCFDALNATDHGKQFLAQAKAKYDSILAFDHPTLSVSPLENALDLARLFDGSRAQIDVLTHSRGGLVTRWWWEVLRPDFGRRGRAVFVGSPLAGTSLASPASWRDLMNYFANLSAVLETASGALSLAAPMLTVSTALLRVFGAATTALAKTPLADAFVATIPGLEGQSRVGNQPGLLRLRSAATQDVSRYFAIQSNFEPDPVGWKFWRVFNRPLDRSFDGVADALFGAETPNDLVVDVSSMSDLSDTVQIADDHRLDFGTNPRVHHVNYFAFPEVTEKLRQWLPGADQS
jgi:hypothetical protein